MRVVEVVARIGDSVIDVAHLRPGARYRIGSARGVDLAVSSLGDFPLVDGGCVRVPAGLAATVDGERDAGPVIPLAGRIVVTVGLVTFTIAHTDAAAEAVPRPRVERRPYAYLAVSLAAQLALWLAAARLAPFERLARPTHRIVRVTHVRATAPPPQPTARPAAPDAAAPEAVAPAAAQDPHRRDMGKMGKRPQPSAENDIDRLYGDPAAQVAHFAKTFDDIDVTGQLARTDGPLVDANTEDPAAFGGGGGHHLDVDRIAPAETYAVQRWALPTFLHGKGVLAPVPAIEWCDEGSCLTRGPLTIDRVVAILARHQKEIAQCYREHTGDLVGNVRVRFPVAADGKVTGTLGTETGPVGYGTGTVGRCVAKIAQGIRWPQAHDETYVFVGLAFRPAPG